MSEENRINRCTYKHTHMHTSTEKTGIVKVLEEK